MTITEEERYIWKADVIKRERHYVRLCHGSRGQWWIKKFRKRPNVVLSETHLGSSDLVLLVGKELAESKATPHTLNLRYNNIGVTPRRRVHGHYMVCPMTVLKACPRAL